MLPKKLQTALAATLLLGFQSQAQLNIQSGATFFMQAGAQVTVQGNVDNAGTLNNDGSLRVQGNYVNTGNYTGVVGTAGVLEMYGTGNANLSPGGSTLANLLINKTAAVDVVTLTASTTVINGFTLTNGVLTTNPSGTPTVALISPATTPYSFAAGKEVVGSVRRTGWINGAARVFNQPNMLVTTSTGTAPTDLTVTMVPNGDPTQSEREVKRKFGFAYTGGSGFTAEVRYPYLDAELTGTNTEPGLVPWRLVTSEWNSRAPLTKDAANNWVSTTGIPAADLLQEWKLADENYTMNITANLRGPWNGTTAMNTSLQTAGLIPLLQPYGTTPFNYFGSEAVGAVPANVVDWVLIEHRKPASGLPTDALVATISGREAGFLLSNGAVVGLDGITPITVPITKQGTAFITIRHRNHLGILSNAIASNAAGTFTNDYTVLANSYKPAGSPSNPVVLLAGAGGKYGMWAGDATKNGAVQAGDINAIKAAVAILASGYQFTDVSLNGAVQAGDITQTKATIAVLGAGSGTNGKISAEKTIKTNLPDPIIED